MSDATVILGEPEVARLYAELERLREVRDTAQDQIDAIGRVLAASGEARLRARRDTADAGDR